KSPRDWAEECIRGNDKVLEFAARQKSLKYVVLSSPFEQYVKAGRQVLHSNGSVMDANAVVHAQLLHTLRSFREVGIEPVIISPPPQTGLDIGRCLSKAMYFGERLESCDLN